jgi:hypothetical protein
MEAAARRAHLLREQAIDACWQRTVRLLRAAVGALRQRWIRARGGRDVLPEG